MKRSLLFGPITLALAVATYYFWPASYHSPIITIDDSLFDEQKFTQRDIQEFPELTIASPGEILPIQMQGIPKTGLQVLDGVAVQELRQWSFFAEFEPMSSNPGTKEPVGNGALNRVDIRSHMTTQSYQMENPDFPGKWTKLDPKMTYYCGRAICPQEPGDYNLSIYVFPCDSDLPRAIVDPIDGPRVRLGVFKVRVEK